MISQAVFAFFFRHDDGGMRLLQGMSEGRRSSRKLHDVEEEYVSEPYGDGERCYASADDDDLAPEVPHPTSLHSVFLPLLRKGQT